MDRTRAGLLAGAARAFAEHGLRRSTMQSIAAAAGVAKATLYNHFRTKDEVAAALLAARARPADRPGRRACRGTRRWPRCPTSSAPTRCCAGWPRPSRRRSAALLAVGPERWAELTARLGDGAAAWTTTAPSWPRRWLLGVVLQPGRSTTRHRHAGRLAAVPRLIGQGGGSDRVSTTRSAPGPAWSRDRWALAPSAVWKASAGRVVRAG